jgi:hypothetical protein
LMAYNFGVEQGFVESGRIATAPAPRRRQARRRRSSTTIRDTSTGGHGSFAVFPFFGLIWVFIVFGVIRRLVWGPRWYRRGWYPYGYYDRGYYDRVPPEFEEWHKRAHGQQPPPTSTPL